MRILLVGGSKSGKSHLAQELCRKLGGKLYYWATMEPTDSEDLGRIERHVLDRDGWGFTTIECGRHLHDALPRIQPDSTVLFDSVTAYLANEMFGETIDADAAGRCAAELLQISTCPENFVCVCDELWRDGVRYDETTENYRAGLAHICRALAEAFDVVYEVIAGIPKLWKGEMPQ